MNTRRCRPRKISERAFFAKLKQILDSGFELDSIPLHWAVDQIMAFDPGKVDPCQ